MEQRVMAVPGGTVETLDSIPPHVWRQLPEDMRLSRSGVQQNRIGVWASKLIPKGKKFGPFVGERKKRSQVTSNVYMWEVYFPAWGWMCVDATDPLKGNWLRYVNWACSTQEQNLFPLEINRAIYYKVLKPIGPGEELLVWYNGEDNPEIAAAIEEERTSSSSKKNSPRARRVTLPHEPAHPHYGTSYYPGASNEPLPSRRNSPIRFAHKEAFCARGELVLTLPSSSPWGGQPNAAPEWDWRCKELNPGHGGATFTPARRKLLERAKQGGLKGAREQKQPCGKETTIMDTAITEMWEPEDVLGAKGDEALPSSAQFEQEGAMSQGPYDQEQQPSMVTEGCPQTCISVMEKEKEEEESHQPALPPGQNAQYSVEGVPMETNEQPDNPRLGSPGREEKVTVDHKWEPPSISLLSNPELDPDPDPDPDPEGEPQESSSFPCQHCERHFTTKQGLERHTHIHVSANHHTHTFKCRYCGKSFGSQIGRRRHERRHENGPKKRPGTLAGTAVSLSPSLQTDSSSPDLVAPSGNFIIMGSQNGGESRERAAVEKHSAAPPIKVERTFVLDENGKSKEPHSCKYCKKVFGTHTNMRRHQRRIHERHLLPKGIHRKGMLLQEAQPEKQPSPPALEESPNSSPPPIYVPSGDAEDEGDQEEEYMVDISSNISENLSLYIDGKILSTSAVSSCEVIEVDSSSAALFGLDAVIIRPDQVSHALKVETTTTGMVKELPSQSMTKRRTTTPPLPPKIKMELESEPIMPSLTSLSSSSSSSLVGALFPQPMETLAFQKEKNVYLSPKLKQLLQTQESHKPTVALVTDGHRLGPPLSVTTLPAGSGRFKRRTASPPNSPQHSPIIKVEGMKSEVGAPFALKVPKLESHCSSPAWSVSSKDERDTMTPPAVDALKVSAVDWPASRSGGSSCNQQPLDLSNAVSKRSDGFIKGPGEVVLDLSMHRKPTTEIEVRGGLAPQPLVKKKKPNTSMLEKVLMNEYAGLDIAGDEGQGMSSSPSTPSALETSPLTGPDACSISPERLLSESPPAAQLHPPPPSLTPVLMHPPSPCTPALGSPTPPPPVLPTASSPVELSTSSELQPVCSPAESPLPVLSPNTPPRPIDTYEEEPPASSELDSNTSVPDENSDSGNVDSNVPSPSLVPNDCTLFPDPSASYVALQACTVESFTSSEDQSSSASISISESSIDPLSIAHGSVVIECTVSVGSSESNVSAPLTVQENPLVESTVGDVVILEQAITSAQHQPISPSPLQSLEPPVLVASLPEPAASMRSPAVISESPPPLVLSPPTVLSSIVKEEPQHKEESANTESARAMSSGPPATTNKNTDEEDSQQDAFSKSFVCNVCETPFRSIKELSRHISDHSEEWPFKCEFCVLLFGNATALLEHRSTLHGVGRIYICSSCTKEFAFLCNLQQHQMDLHPGQDCAHTEVENGKLRPQNYNDPSRVSTESSPSSASDVQSGGAGSASQQLDDALKEEEELDNSTEELYTTIKIMASEGGKPKGPDVRLGINQHYPSFKPPPFPYHNRTPAGSVASATNFTTHNIPQTFNTAIRCTKCGKSFDNMPELHKHILACANASDKKRYTPKKNPIPLKQIAKPQNGVLSPAAADNARQNAFRRMGQPKRLNFSQEPSAKMKLNALNKKKNQLLQKAISQRNRSATSAKKGSAPAEEEEEQEVHVCPHCSREFTYRGSLNKHVAVSCPMKPVSKRPKKGKGRSIPVAQENNGNLRRRTADTDIKQPESKPVQKTLGKTRARSSGPPTGGANLPLPSKGRMATPPLRAKRPASFPPATAPFSKKNKTIVKGSFQSQQHSLSSTLPPVSLVPPGGSSQRQAVRMQRAGGKEMPSKREAEVKAQQPQPQLKKEERFLMRMRERVGGPVTRSLQQAGLVASTEVKGVEGAISSEPREPQDPSSKLAG